MVLSIIFAPLIGFLFSLLFGRYFHFRVSQVITTTFLIISAIFSWIIFFEYISAQEESIYQIFNWITSGSLSVDWSIRVDSLSVTMFIVVSTVSACVHLYSIGYMSEDPSKIRFMGYLSLFTFFMLILVSSNNLLQMFFGWEGVGLASYLLIGFWHHKNSANKAAIKAFIVNRVGDFGFAIGIFLIFMFFGTLNYNEVFQLVPEFSQKEINFLGFNSNLITLICLFLFVGAMGKSAQFFLHTWLPDAMEGPTPVSALIHAATMVTAGVFLVVRCSPIFEYSQTALIFVTVIGMLTAFFAASVAIVQNDIKRIIAYSTCSQLGYMFFAAGVGAYHVAIFHLFTHAFFKALLFLGSGSVIHSLNEEQDIRNMGGIWRKMPFTWIAMIIGTLALTGFPFLSGYYSKDAIIEFAYLKNSNIGYFAAGVGIITAFLTAIYSWRLIFKTFHGKFNNKNLSRSEIHDSGIIIILPLGILVFGSIFSGFLFKDFLIGYRYTDFWKDSILILNIFDHSLIPSWLLYMTPVLVCLAIPLSYYLYIKDSKILDKIKIKNEFIYNFLLNKWYFDEVYDLIFVKPIKSIGSFLWKSGDVKTIDRLGPDGISKIIKIISKKSTKFQSGYIYDYAFVMLIGLSLLLTIFIFYK